MLRKIFYADTPLGFGKYSENTIREIFFINPHYVRWAFINANFCVDIDDFERLIEESVTNGNSSTVGSRLYSREAYLDYFSSIWEINKERIAHIKSLRVKHEDWFEPDSVWKEKWRTILPNAPKDVKLTREDENIFEKWREDVIKSQPKKGYFVGDIIIGWLQQPSDETIIAPGSTHKADFKFGHNYILLSERHLSRAEIVKRESFFANVIWIINYESLKGDTELIVGHVISEFINKYASASIYLEFYQTKLFKTKRSLRKQQDELAYKVTIAASESDNTVLDRRAKNIRLTEQYLNLLAHHIQNCELDITNIQQYLDEDWSACVRYPTKEGGFNGFYNVPSPVFFDMGDYLYIRKFASDDFSYPHTAYLKKISYFDFQKWINNPLVAL